VKTAERVGVIHADLAIGANVSGAVPLRANTGVCFQGFVLVGEGFCITQDEANNLVRLDANSSKVIRPWKNGRDVMQSNRGMAVIDLYPLSESETRAQYPAVFQWLLDRVKPFRDHVARKGHREKWWLWGEARPGLRTATNSLSRCVVTNFAAKHRIFVFESPKTALDHNIYIIASDDAMMLGVLSSRVHVTWMLRAGSSLEDRPLWISSTCFLPFPFPAATPEQQARIRSLAEQIDAHRKRQQAAHAELTLTGMYNVLDKLKVSLPMTAKEKAIHEMGLVSVLRSLHDELDAAVLAAYGWNDAPSDETILERLVALNAERAAEEVAGQVRWLRPAFQHPEQAQPVQAEMGLSRPTHSEAAKEGGTSPSPPPATKQRLPWPNALPEQVAAVARVLAEARAPLAEADLAARFTGKGPWKKRLPQLLDTLVALGRARQTDGGWMGS
jgi:hypothetical protein